MSEVNTNRTFDLCKVIDAFLIDFKSDLTEVDTALWVKCVPLVSAADNDVEMVTGDVFSFGAFNQSQFENVYRKTLFPANKKIQDALISMYEKNEATLEALDDEDSKASPDDLTFPKLWLLKETIKAPEKFVRFYTADGDDWQAGDPIKDDDGKIKVFDEYTVVALCDDQGKALEDVNRIAKREWRVNCAYNEKLGFSVWQTLAEYTEETVNEADTPAPATPEKPEKSAGKRNKNRR